VSALQQLLQSIESEIALARLDGQTRSTPISEALAAYIASLEEARVKKYCDDHSIRPPTVKGLSPMSAAERLLEAVEKLPELAQLLLARRALESVEAPLDENSSASDLTETPPEPGPESEIDKQFRLKFPELAEGAQLGKLLIFGVFNGKSRRLPGPLAEAGEWIDTSSGSRIVASAVRRIQSGHVFAVIICDQAIAHQHAEPVVNSARNQKIPVAYAQKGGTAALARALESLEGMLAKP
jgi:hypothetical protein